MKIACTRTFNGSTTTIEIETAIDFPHPVEDTEFYLHWNMFDLYLTKMLDILMQRI